jgi:hypothetical protein
MNEESWDAFLKGKLEVLVRPTNIVPFLQLCEEKGLRWASFDKPTKYNPFEVTPYPLYIAVHSGKLVVGMTNDIQYISFDS